MQVAGSSPRSDDPNRSGVRGRHPPLPRRHGSYGTVPQPFGPAPGRRSGSGVRPGRGASALVGTRVTVTMEIAAEIPGGAPDNAVRKVTENSPTLKFGSPGFEEE